MSLITSTVFYYHFKLSHYLKRTNDAHIYTFKASYPEAIISCQHYVSLSQDNKLLLLVFQNELLSLKSFVFWAAVIRKKKYFSLNGI